MTKAIAVAPYISYFFKLVKEYNIVFYSTRKIGLMKHLFEIEQFCFSMIRNYGLVSTRSSNIIYLKELFKLP